MGLARVGVSMLLLLMRMRKGYEVLFLSLVWNLIAISISGLI
jgi:hypothetical protein